jgi:hypothetical protein
MGRRGHGGPRGGPGDPGRGIMQLPRQLEQLAQEFPSGRTHYLFAMTMMNLGLAQEAAFRKAIEDEECVLGRAGLGLLFFRQGQTTRVAKEWRTLRSIDPRWRLPGNWLKILDGEPALLEEFAKAPR